MKNVIFCSKLFHEWSKKSDSTDLDVSIIKPAFKHCANVSILLGHLNSNILCLCKECFAPKLNSSFRQLTFESGSHPEFLFGDDLKQKCWLVPNLKKYSELNKSISIYNK